MAEKFSLASDVTWYKDTPPPPQKIPTAILRCVGISATDLQHGLASPGNAAKPSRFRSQIFSWLMRHHPHDLKILEIRPVFFTTEHNISGTSRLHRCLSCREMKWHDMTKWQEAVGKKYFRMENQVRQTKKSKRLCTYTSAPESK